MDEEQQLANQAAVLKSQVDNDGAFGAIEPPKPSLVIKHTSRVVSDHLSQKDENPKVAAGSSMDRLEACRNPGLPIKSNS